MLDASGPGVSGGTPPKVISLTDPCARWTAAPGGPAFFAYSTNYLVDVQAGIIVDVEATPAHRTQEVEATKSMLERVEKRFDMTPACLIGDTAYGTAPMLGWIVDEKKVQPHIPVWDKSERDDGTFSRSDFMFDAENNRYICPAGKYLKPAWRSKQKNPFRYRASLYDCQACPLKTKCCPNMAIRKIDRSPHEPRVMWHVRSPRPMRTDNRTKIARRSRSYSLTLRRILKLDRLRLRGLTGAHDEFLLAATVQNLRRMTKWLRSPLPETTLGPRPWFLRLRCADCTHEKRLAFSCKRCGFCPSCGTRRMV